MVYSNWYKILTWKRMLKTTEAFIFQTVLWKSVILGGDEYFMKRNLIVKHKFGNITFYMALLKIYNINSHTNSP